MTTATITSTKQWPIRFVDNGIGVRAIGREKTRSRRPWLLQPSCRNSRGPAHHRRSLSFTIHSAPSPRLGRLYSQYYARARPRSIHAQRGTPFRKYTFVRRPLRATVRRPTRYARQFQIVRRAPDSFASRINVQASPPGNAFVRFVSVRRLPSLEGENGAHDDYERPKHVYVRAGGRWRRLFGPSLG